MKREPIVKKTLDEIKVSNIMNGRPRYINPETSIDGLLERLLGEISGCLPVVDKDMKILGIITESDVIKLIKIPLQETAIGGHDLLKEVRKRSASTAGEIMTKRPVLIAPNDSIQGALNVMASNKLRHLPVAKDGKLVGLLCLRDIIELYKMLR